MNLFKKIVAGTIATTLMVGMTACGDTSLIGTVDGDEVAAGVYIYNQYQALSDVYSSEDFDKDKKDPWDNVIDDKKLETWVNDKAVEKLKISAEIKNQLEEYGLSLSQEELDAVDYSVETNWATYQETLESIGISQNSYREVLLSSQEQNVLFNYVYGEDGPQAVANKDLEEYFKTDYAQFKQIAFSKSDEEGEALSDDEKAKVKKTAESYLEKAKKDITKFDELIDEYYDSLKTDEELEEEKSEEKDEDKEVDENANKIMIQKDQTSYYVSDVLSKAIFAQAKVGEPILLNDDDYYYVILRCDVMESDDTYKDAREALLYNLKSEDYNKYLVDSSSEIKFEANDSAINRYSPKKILED